MILPPPLIELEEDEEKDLKKWGGWIDGREGGCMDVWTLNGVISRAPVELITTNTACFQCYTFVFTWQIIFLTNIIYI